MLCPKDGPQWTIETPQVLAEIEAVQRRTGLKHVYIATIHPPMVTKCARAPPPARAASRRRAPTLGRAPRRRYGRELSTLLQSVGGAQSASDLAQMASRLGVADDALTRWDQSLIEQQLCATAHAFLGSDRSTWTGNVALERDATGKARNSFFGAVNAGARMVELRS